MCGSMAAIQSAAAEIRRGKKKKKEQTTAWKYIWSALFHRATINYESPNKGNATSLPSRSQLIEERMMTVGDFHWLGSVLRDPFSVFTELVYIIIIIIIRKFITRTCSQALSMNRRRGWQQRSSTHRSLCRSRDSLLNRRETITGEMNG